MLGQVGFTTTEVIAIATAMLGALIRNVMLLAGLEMNTETLAVVGAAFGALWALMYFLINEKNKEIERNERLLLGVADKFEELEDQKQGRDHRKKRDRPAPVIAESNSVPTPAQQKVADNQTVKARITASLKALGLEPLEDPAMPKSPTADAETVPITGTAKITADGSLIRVKAEGTKPKE